MTVTTGCWVNPDCTLKLFPSERVMVQTPSSSTNEATRALPSTTAFRAAISSLSFSRASTLPSRLAIASFTAVSSYLSHDAKRQQTVIKAIYILFITRPFIVLLLSIIIKMLELAVHDKQMLKLAIYSLTVCILTDRQAKCKDYRIITSCFLSRVCSK